MTHQSRFNITRTLPYIILTIWSFFLLFTIFKGHAFIGGIDCNFHMNSIYNDAMQIKTGNFNYFLANYGFEKSGRIVNALYAPGANYILGWLLLKCGSWINFEMLVTFLSILFGSILMYLACLVFHMHRTSATICGIMSTVTHTIVVSWMGNQEFTGLGELLFPIIFIIGIRLSQTKKVHPLLIGFALTLFLQVHLFTALLAGLVLFIYMIDGLVYSNNKKKYIFKSIGAGLWTLGLNCNVFGALQDVFGSNHLMPTYPQPDVQNLGMKWTSGQNGMPLSSGFASLGIVLSILIIIPILVIIFSKKQHQDLKLTASICITSFILYSAYFPWDALDDKYPVLAQLVQFPKRFSAPFWIPFFLILGYIFDTMYYRAKSNHVHVIWRIIPILPLIFIIWSWWLPNYNYVKWLPTVYTSGPVLRYENSVYKYHTNSRLLRKHANSNNLKSLLDDEQKATPDYLPTLYRVSLKNYSQYHSYGYITNDFLKTYPKWKNRKVVDGNKILINWHATSTKKIKVPITKYAHTSITQDGHKIHPVLDNIGVPTINQHVGMNHLCVEYHSGAFFKNSVIIMIISWISGIIVVVKYYLKIKKED